ncbi:thiamine/thiamine pyrophosphate ABC transporter permease ThiP [Mesobaculum littorinae]|uniref:Thiamine/thiamine pyrophosphate ABC transporter permease ThiP n=1 Tax=Mesobaculum littorinae TaxID=2486419 RepID=A0A438AFA9_9RHOB|nr:thiamine/thiamine pyrophosphate ABC transporter permease ThiP [Mesobaculum littorinae]RVV97362.1 thiamine/thiamine pyrophosphate ABC transporter permease ThiP [Mesobaculum littorinae]
MADRPQPLGAAGAAGLIAAAVVLALTLGTALLTLSRAQGVARLGAADWAAIRFTLGQAAISAGLSVALAIPVARALARRRFAGRAALVTLLGAPFILPVIVAVLGLLTVFGRNGWASAALDLAGLPPLDIYGGHGVILAHVFLNLPLATRLILQGWLAVPSERFRLAADLGFGPPQIRRHIEWPMLREVCPGTLIVIFLVCTTSFAVALTLGGGPRATTVELAIYQAFRFEFDLGKAALLALVQLALSGVAALLALGLAVPQAAAGGLDRAVERWDAQGPWHRGGDAALIALAAAFLVLPLLAIFLDGVPGLARMPASIWGAALRSLAVALASGALTLALALPMALAAARPRPGARMVEAAGYLSVAVSPLVIGVGLFLLVRPIANPTALALPVTALVNAAMSLPFALRALIPAARATEAIYGPLADQLGLQGRARLRRLILPRLRRPMGFAMALAAALSMGDLGVIALFTDPSAGTLPFALYGLMGAYRMDAAAGAALILLASSLALFWLFDRGGRLDADT